MSAIGYLITHAVTSDAAIPVEDATVLVTQMGADGLVALLAMRLSDESGKTLPLEIVAPDIAESLTPQPGTPFSVVTITAEHPAYTRIVVEDVQIFPGETAVQVLQLIPLDEQPALWDETAIFDVPPQNL